MKEPILRLIFSVVFFSFLISDLSANLEVHFPLDEESISSSDGQFSGQIISSSTIELTNGIVGGFYERTTIPPSSQGYLQTNHPGISGSKERAVSIWFQASGITGSVDTLFGWGRATTLERYDFRMSGNNLRIEIAGNGHDFPVEAQGFDIRDGQWHHAYLSFSGSRLSDHVLYVDGHLIGKATGTEFVRTGGQVSVRLGTGVQRHQGGGSTTRDFDGNLDDFGLFSVARGGVDAALIHGLGRVGHDLRSLEVARGLWLSPSGTQAIVGEQLWEKVSGLSGGLAAYGGSKLDGDAFIVLDEFGNGIEMKVAKTSELSIDEVSPLSLGFGLSGELEVTVTNANLNLGVTFEIVQQTLPAQFVTPNFNGPFHLGAGETATFPVTVGDSEFSSEGFNQIRLVLRPLGISLTSLDVLPNLIADYTVGEPVFELAKEQIFLSLPIGHSPDRFSVAVSSLVDGEPIVGGLTAESDQPWLLPVISENRGQEVDVYFDTAGLPLGTHLGTVFVSNSETQREVIFQVTVEELKIRQAIVDPQRNRLYALHTSSLILVYDTESESLVRSIVPSEHVNDLAISSDNGSLFASGLFESAILEFDLESFRQIDEYRLPYISASPAIKVESGPNEVLYYSSANNFPSLRILDLKSRSILGDDLGYSSVQDVAVAPNGDELYVWQRRITLSSPNWLERANLTESGLIVPMLSESSTPYPRFEADDSAIEMLLSSDGDWLAVANKLVQTSDLDRYPLIFPTTIRAFSPRAEVVSTSDELFDGRTGERIASLPFPSDVQVFTPDGEKIFAYDSTRKQVGWVDVSSRLESPLVVTLPVDDAIVAGLQELQWQPTPDFRSYHVFVGKSEAAVEAATINSPEFRGQTHNNFFSLEDLEEEEEIFWRIDAIGRYEIRKGEIWSFQNIPLEFDQSPLYLERPTGLAQVSGSLGFSSSQTFSLSTTGDWLQAEFSASGETIDYSISSEGLAPGNYQADIILEFDEASVRKSLFLTVVPFNLTQLIPHPSEPIAYALHSPAQGRGDSLLLEIDAMTATILRQLEVGLNANDLEVSTSGENLYIHNLYYGLVREVDAANWQLSRVIMLPSETEAIALLSPDSLAFSADSTWHLLRLNDEQVVELTRAISGNVGAGHKGELLALSPSFVSFFLSRWRIEDGETTLISSTVQPFSGGPLSRVLLSQNDSLVATSIFLFNRDLELLRLLPEEVVALSADGFFAFGTDKVWLAVNGEEVGRWTTSADFQAPTFDGEYLLRFDSGSGVLSSESLSSIRALRLQVPHDGEVVTEELEALAWPPVADAVSYEVFLSADENEVQDGDLSGPAFAGSTSESSLALTEPLIPGEVYFWKVVTNTSSGVQIESRINSFRVQYGAARAISIDSLVEDFDLASGKLILSRGDEARVYDFDAATGMETFTSSIDPFSGTPAFGDTHLFVGQPDFNDGNTSRGTGAFLSYRRESLGWFLDEIIQIPDTENDQVGHSISASDNLLVVGGLNEGLVGNRTFVYSYFGNDLEAQPQVLFSPIPTDDDFFGLNLDHQANTLAVLSRSSPTGVAVFDFDPQTGQWMEAAALSLPPGVVNPVASRVAVGEGVLCYMEGDLEGSRVHIYERDAGSNFVFRQTIASDAVDTASIRFGLSLAFAKGTLFIGDYEGRIKQDRSGAVFTFRKKGDRWVEGAAIEPMEGIESFGYEVDAQDGWLAIGSNPREMIPSRSIYLVELEQETGIAPSFLSPPLASALTNQESRHPITIGDGDELTGHTVTVSSGGSWVSVESDGNQHSLVINPPLSAAQTSVSIQLLAEDSLGNRTRQTFRTQIVATQGAPVFSLLPEAQVTSEGRDLVLSVEVEGSAPISYQWQKDGVEIAGAIEPVLEIQEIGSSESGLYTLTASNVAGTVTSDPISVAVGLPSLDAGPYSTQGVNMRRSGYYPARLGNFSLEALWERTFAGSTLNNPLIAEGQVYLESRFQEHSRVTALNLLDGSTSWESAELPLHLSPSTWFEGKLYFQTEGPLSSDAFMVAMDAGDGSVLWQAPFLTQGQNRGAPAVTKEGVWSAAGRSGGLFHWALADGNQLAEFDFGRSGPWAPTISSGRIFTSASRELSEHNPVDGEIIWTTSPSVLVSSPQPYPAVRNDRAVLTTTEEMICVNIDTRETIWSLLPPLSENESPFPFPGLLREDFSSTPSIAGESVFVSTSSGFHEYLLADGSFVKTYLIPSASNNGSYLRFLILSDTVIVGGNDGIWIFDRSDATVLASLPEVGNFVYAAGTLIVSSGETLRAFRVASNPLVSRFSVETDAQLLATATGSLWTDYVINPLSIRWDQEQRMRLAYQRAENWGEFSYQILSSSDLLTWEKADLEIVDSIQDNPDGTQIVEYLLPAESTAQFYRLEVTRNNHSINP